eukprot:Plantae.Rhodophyta-Hildenbrandia_rubra.ctg16164.p2 GENE.Plantae.Rhodophyta-Hildenbrandia_rubra.ctg16164~~Plantae.Rhodophyta-Hildenbrandia_rubra.ctg16164.p2  ORF type:complete len:381 (+),score=104.97 Plantae.Rhodophyta-Hildenbrandia_rubra.ctg16164:69-1211(+)
MGGRRGGSRRRKKRTHIVPTVEDGGDGTPRSFVFRRGVVPAAIRELITDVRSMLMPYTARNLKERRKNSLRDYVAVAGRLGITHFWTFSSTLRGPYLRIMRVPQGPTLGFRVLEYTLGKDVRGMQRRPVLLGDMDFKEPPLLVLSRFVQESEDGCGKILAEMFRHSFPPIDVKTVELSDVRRVVLVDKDEETGIIYVRHYAIRVQAVDLSKTVRKLVLKRRLPKMGKLNDAAELIEKDGGGAFSSDSEVEDPEMKAASRVTLSEDVKKLKKGATTSIKLVEVGPRLSLEFVKAEGGLSEGEILYNKYVTKTEEEIKETAKKIEERKELKRKRKDAQNENVERKREAKRAKKERRRASRGERGDDDADEASDPSASESASE